MFLKSSLQPLQDIVGVLDTGFFNINLLEAARQRPVLVEDAAIFLVGGRANAADFTRSQQRFQQVGRIHHAARGCARADNGMDFVDKQDLIRRLFQFVQERFQTFLKIAAILGACQQCAEIEGVHSAVFNHIRHLAIDN